MIAIACVLALSVISLQGATAEENNKSAKENSNSVTEFAGSTIRSHGHPIANLTESPTGGTSQDQKSYVNNDDANAELNWQQWNKANGKATGKASIGSVASNPILYRSTGSLHTYSGDVQIIPVWVGTWDSTKKSNWNRVLGNLVTSLASTSINTAGHVFNTNLGYFSPTPILSWPTPTLTWPNLASATIAASGTLKNGIYQVSDSNVASYISTALKTNVISAGKKPIYVYLGASNTRLSSGFGTAYCGWHSIGTLTVNTITYSNIPFIAIQDFQNTYLSSCAVQSSKSPNGDAQLDAMASVLVHEIDEALSDPDLKSWYDAAGAENADKCAWTFGTGTAIFTNTYGGSANVTLGGLQYMIQRNWLANNLVKDTAGTACVLTNP